MDATEEMKIYFSNLYRSKQPLDVEAETLMATMGCQRCPKCGLWVGEEDLEADGCNCCDGLTVSVLVLKTMEG